MKLGFIYAKNLFVTILYFAFSICEICFGQRAANLVTNGSFELINSNNPPMPIGWDATSSAKFFGQLLMPPGAVPLSSYGYQLPKEGQNHLISLLYYQNDSLPYRSYPRNHLKDSLKNNCEYCVSFYLNLSDNSTYGIDAIGAYFGDNSLDTIKYSNSPITYLLPQISNGTNNFIIDTMNWVEVKGSFVANGGEYYMLIGNFKADSSTNKVLVNPTHLPSEASDYLIDKVTVFEMELPPYAGKDTAVMWGDSAFIGREPDVGIDEACQWYQLPNDTVPIDTIAGLWVKPVQTTTYVVRQQLWCSGVKWDTVVVYVGFVGLRQIAGPADYQLAPNPAKDIVFLTGLPDGTYGVTVLEASGKLLNSAKLLVSGNTAMLPLDYDSGLYFVVIETPAASLPRKLIIQK